MPPSFSEQDAAPLPASSVQKFLSICRTARRCASRSTSARASIIPGDGSWQSGGNGLRLDQPVIPAGSIVSGQIISINPVSGVKRTLAYANGDFSPFHKYEPHLRCSLCPMAGSSDKDYGFNGNW